MFHKNFMKRLLLTTILVMFFAVTMFGANPSYQAFIGTNGIIIRSNPPQGKIIIDGFLLTNGLSGGGTGTVVFSDLVWTNDNGVLKPVSFPTNILLRVNAPDNAVATNFYFDSRVYRTNAASKLFAIYNGGSNALTVGPYGGIFEGLGNASPSPGVVLSGIFDTALGETNQQEVFIMSQNSSVGYNGAADLIVDTNYGALILVANKEGGTKFSRFAIQTGAGLDPQNFNTFSMQALVDGATYFLVDPNFTTLTPTNYLFSSSVRITNIHTLMSLQNSNTPVLEVDGVGDLRMIKRIPYLWPSAQGAVGTALTNNGSGGLGWWPISVGSGGSGITNLFSPTLSNATIKPLVVGIGDAAGATNTTGEIRGLEAGANITITPNGSNYVIASTGGSGIGGTNVFEFINLSVQAGKLPFTNYPSIDGGWQGWETVYFETNAEGARANLSANWQFMVPPDYTSNTMSVLLNYSLLGTNGPNVSNVIWGVSVLPIRSGTTNNFHTNLFGFTVYGTNDWIPKYDGTNITTNIVISLGTNAALYLVDLALVKIERVALGDTYGGAVALQGIQLQYTGTNQAASGSGGGSGITNLFTPSLSNATIKPIVFGGVGNAAGMTNLTGQLYGLEAGGNITLTPNGSNIVVASTAGGGSVNFSDLLWTNEPSGRIHPVEFTNRVELQRSLTIGTNAESFSGAPGTNDFIFAVRDITKAEDYNPKIEFAVTSNSVHSLIASILTRDQAAWRFRHNDEGGNVAAAIIGADKPGGTIILTSTNGSTQFAVVETNIFLNSIGYVFPGSQGSAGTVITNDGAGILGWGTVAGGAASALSFTNQLWVELRGNDATGARNDPSKPFQSITNAIRAALSNDVINIGVGRFTNFSPGIILSNNLTLRGVGQNNTVLCFTNNHVVHGPGLKPMTNTTIENLALEVPVHMGTLVSAPIGFHESFTDIGGTNVVFRNVKVRAFSDNIIIVSTTNIVQMFFYDCDFESNGDIIVLHGHGTNSLYFKNCKVFVSGPVAPAVAVRMLNMSAGFVHYDTSSLVATNNNAETWDALNLIGGSARLDNCYLSASTNSGSANLVNTAGAGKVEFNGMLQLTNNMTGNVVMSPPFVSGVAAGANITITTNSSSVVTIVGRSPVTLSANSTPVISAGAAETNLITYSVPANTLTNSGDRLIIRASGRFAATANAKQIKLILGSETILDTTSQIVNSGSWVIEGEIIRTGNTAQSTSAEYHGAGLSLFTTASAVDLVQTNGIATVLKLVSTAAGDGDVTNRTLTVEWWPAP